MELEIINKIFSIFEQNNPHPKTELEYTNNFTLAVAVILSAQSTDISVNKATKNLFKNYNTPEQIIELGEEALKDYIKTIGLYNSKAKNIINLSKILAENFASLIPNNFNTLISLPGIGHKTANVILNAAFKEPTIAVDTHVYRVSKRIGLSKASSPQKLEKDLASKIPDTWLMNAHNWLVLHGRYICKARSPLCMQCKISDFCTYYSTNNIAN